MQPVLDIEGLRKRYHNSRNSIMAVDGVSLVVNPGEVVGFLGPNGAGKTTVVKCACGLVAPDGGRVLVAGNALDRERDRALHQLGAVLEGARNVYWQLTPEENLCYFGQMRAVANRVISKRSKHLFDRLGLADVADRPLKDLSRGTQQRVAVAVALIHDPALVLLDEPTLGLDVASSTAVVEEIRRIADHEGKGVLLTTHQMEVAEALCDRIAIIKQGRLLLCEGKHELLHRFNQHRVAEITISGHLSQQERLKLLDVYPTLGINDESDECKLALPPWASPPPEQLFVDVWRAGKTIRTFSRATSLQEAFLKLIYQSDGLNQGEAQKCN